MTFGLLLLVAIPYPALILVATYPGFIPYKAIAAIEPGKTSDDTRLFADAPYRCAGPGCDERDLRRSALALVPVCHQRGGGAGEDGRRAAAHPVGTAAECGRGCSMDSIRGARRVAPCFDRSFDPVHAGLPPRARPTPLPKTRAKRGNR